MWLEGSSADISPAGGDTVQINEECSSARDYKVFYDFREQLQPASSQLSLNENQHVYEEI